METRWRRLIDAGIAVTSELTLDAVLQRIVETAADLTSARYAALGVIDRSGVALERFLAWFQRFRPYLAWVERVSGAILIILGILLITDRFTVLAGYLQGLTPDFLRDRL